MAPRNLAKFAAENCGSYLLCPRATEGVGALCDATIRPSVCLSHAARAKSVRFRHRTLTGNLMLEVEPIGQRGLRNTGSGQNGNDFKNLRRQ